MTRASPKTLKFLKSLQFFFFTFLLELVENEKPRKCWKKRVSMCNLECVKATSKFSRTLGLTLLEVLQKALSPTPHFYHTFQFSLMCSFYYCIVK